MSAPDKVLALLRALCAGLAPGGIEVVPDETRTAFMPGHNRILVSRRFLTANTTVALGALLHEVGHVLVTRYDHIAKPKDVARALWREGLNAVEESRVHHFLGQRLPGARRFLEPLFALDEVPTGDHFESDLLAFLGAAATWDRYRDLPFLAYRPVAAAAFARTDAARRCYAATLPPSDFVVRPDLARRYARDVAPILNGGDDVSITSGEAEIRCAAVAALAIFHERIWPEIERLAASDRSRIAMALRDDPDLREQAELVVETPVAGQLAGRALRMTPATAGEADHFEKLAASMFEQYLRRPDVLPRRVRASALTSMAFAETPAESTLEGAAQPTTQAAVAPPNESNPEALAAILREALPRRPRQWIAGYRSGVRLNLERAMHAMATGEQTDRIWARRVADRPMLATMLLVDLSGSMSNNGKIESAIAATRALSAALASLRGVSWAVLGFQDRIIPFVGFDERADAAVLTRIAEMSDEVAGIRKNGNNRPRYNDDGPCLRESAALLARRPEQDRLLIVISDGAPAGRHSGAKELHEAVAAVQAMPNLTLVGLGIGPSTTHVTRFYPRARASIEPGDLAAAIGALLADRLRASSATVV